MQLHRRLQGHSYIPLVNVVVYMLFCGENVGGGANTDLGLMDKVPSDSTCSQAEKVNFTFLNLSVRPRPMLMCQPLTFLNPHRSNICFSVLGFGNERGLPLNNNICDQLTVGCKLFHTGKLGFLQLRFLNYLPIGFASQSQQRDRN